MEDWKNGENDYNDVAFVISNPIAAIEVPDVPNPGDRQGTEMYSGVLGLKITGRNKARTHGCRCRSTRGWGRRQGYRAPSWRWRRQQLGPEPRGACWACSHAWIPWQTAVAANQVELFLDGKRPKVREWRGVAQSIEVRDVLGNLPPVVEEQQRRQDVGAHLGEHHG